MQRGPRVALGLGAALLAGIIGFVALHHPGDATRSAPAAEAVPVVAGSVTTRDVPILIRALGSAAADRDGLRPVAGERPDHAGLFQTGRVGQEG